jgi:type IV fimbrial biogenesis protein FimT
VTLRGREMTAGNRLKQQSGFTLIELLVTIAVAVILATVAVPGFQSMVASNREAADYNEILTGLIYARSEAVKRRQEVSAVITSAGGVWRLEVQHGGDVIRVMEARHNRVAVSPNTISFNSLGRRSGCNLNEDDECVVAVGSGPNEIAVNLSGRIEKRPIS